MATERINQLQQFYEDDPNDPFNLYALTLEYLKYDHQKAAAYFDLLVEKHKDYLPTYYHAAKFFLEAGNRDKAIQLYERGLALARELRDSKAQRELQSAYDELMFE
jgi:tetratricopeptide (TPR) repeat protein